MDATKLKVWLPFDESTTADKCGNTWTATGDVSLDTTITKFGGASVHLPRDAYLTANNVIDINADKWTFDAWAYCVSRTGDDGFFALSEGANRRGIIAANDGVYVASSGGGSWQTKNTSLIFPSVKNQWVHLAIVKNGTSVAFYQDGVAVWSFTTSGLNNNGVFILGGCSYGYGNDIYFDEVRFFEGEALWTANFTPPIAGDYEDLAIELDGHFQFTADVQRRIGNRFSFTADVQRTLKTKWRYINLGTADTLTISGFTLENLDESQSKTGTAFYQTAREKCFDIPDTDEVWIKFDVYQDSSDQWRAYNDGSAGICGLFSYDHTTFRLFANGTAATDIANIFKTNQLQTVLLHMISGSSAGIIEAWVDGTKIYTYTGDVNHGEDFADIYLQSDGEGTFFSNVIISNAEIGLNDGYITFSADVQRRISSRFELIADVQRKVNNVIPFAFDADVVIRDILPVTFSADVQRRLTTQFEFSADVAIFDTFPFEFDADINRAIKAKLKLFAIDTSEYFSGGGLSSSGDSAETLTPVVIPSQRIPPAVDNSIGLQSIEISLTEQQLTDNVAFVGVVPFDIMFPVQGQYLDYVFDMRVERVQQRGVLYSCECCADIDQLLYTQIAYTIPPSTAWSSGGTSSANLPSKPESTPASSHARCLAATIGKTPVIQFDDFQSTVLMENSGGATYADLIRDVFGWSSRVPTHLINVFIRADKIYFVQRGHELRLLDLSGTKHTIPTITHELVRMTWGSTPWSKTETRETTNHYLNPEDCDETGVISPKDANSGTSGGTSGGSGLTVTPEDGDEETWVTIQDVSSGINWIAYTSYYYYPKYKKGIMAEGSLPMILGGLLGKVEVIKSYLSGDEADSFTQILHSYDRDKNKIQTETYVHYSGGKNTPKDTLTRNTMNYITLPNGEKYLASESTVVYEDNKLVDSTSTTHSPARQGQTHTIKFGDDGDIIGENVGQNTGDDRVTPFSSNKRNVNGTNNSVNGISGTVATYRYNATTGEWEKISELKEETDTQSLTLNGLSLYDSSFPIHNTNKLVELTEAIKWLNRRTKEIVSMTIYEYPHLIDFNDRIIFNGAQYFLVSNIATTNARIFNEQRITFVRWY